MKQAIKRKSLKVGQKETFEGWGILSPKGIVLEAFRGDSLAGVRFVLSRRGMYQPKSHLVKVSATVERVDRRTIQKKQREAGAK